MTKKKRNSSFHLIFVSEKTQGMRQFHVKPLHIRIMGVSVVLLLSLLVLNSFGFWYYRTRNAELKQDRLMLNAYQMEKAAFVTKVASLEKTLQQTNDLTKNLQKLVGDEKKDLQRGIGPIGPSKFEIKDKTTPVTFDKLEDRMVALQEETLSLQDKIRDLTKAQETKLSLYSNTPSFWPVKGWVTSTFGYRQSPFSMLRDFHAGMDIAAPNGTPILATAGGVVTLANYKNGYGKTVIVDHGFGVQSLYGHTSELLVTEGQKVKKGQQLALVGSTGQSTGPHVHFEVHVDGVPVDPKKYLAAQ